MEPLPALALTVETSEVALGQGKIRSLWGCLPSWAKKYRLPEPKLEEAAVPPRTMPTIAQLRIDWQARQCHGVALGR